MILCYIYTYVAAIKTEIFIVEKWQYVKGDVVNQTILVSWLVPWGEGVKLTTPSFFLLWYKSITIDTFLETPWALLLQKSAKNGRFSKIQIFIAKSILKAKYCANKNSANWKKLYISKKPFTQQIQMCKNN